MNNDLIYQLSLSFIPQIGPVQARILTDHFGDASAVFKAKKTTLDKLEGIGTIRAACIKEFSDFRKAEAEIKFMEKFRITPLFLTNKLYPQRLLNCYDPPTVLYYRGAANLNAPRIISVIGTRNNSDYGKKITEELIDELSGTQAIIVSGLAFGIDALAHKAAIKNKLPTVAVLGHGLDTIYPLEHSQLAKNIIHEKGGLLTEYISNTKPDKHNFPTRNRIVAGMCDATIVVETGIKGGSMITAELANSYNKDVFAFPGKVTDSKSEGCNHLIKNNKAVLLTGAKHLIEILGWEENKKTKPDIQKILFAELNDQEKIIIRLLAEKESISVDELNMKCSLSSSLVASTLLSLELKGAVISKPGKIYSLT